MLGLVAVELWIEIISPQHPSQRLDLIEISGEMQPAFPVVVSEAAKQSESLWIVLVGVDGDGEKENIHTHAITEELVNLDQVLGDAGSYTRAGGVEELDDDDAVLDQIAVKPVLFSLVIDENRVRELVGVATARR